MRSDPPPTSARAAAPVLGPELVIVVGGLTATAHASMMIVIPALPRFMDELGGAVFFGSAFALGMALSSSSIGRFMTNIPAGMLSEKIGRKHVIIVGALIVALFSSLSGTASNAPIFWLYRFLIGIGSAMTITVANVVATDLSTVENRGRVLGLMHGMQLIVGISTPALGGFLAEWVSLRTPFYVSGVGIVVFAIWALFRLPETRPQRIQQVARVEGGAHRRFETLGLLKDNRFLLICLLGFATFFLRGGAMTGLIPLYADQVLAMGPGMLGILFTVSSLIHGILVYPAGAASDRYGRKPMIVPAGVLVGIGIAVIPFTNDLLTFGIAFVFLLAAMGWGGQAPTAYLGDIAPEGMRGVSFGLYRTFGDAAGIVGPLIATGLADAISFQAAFLFGAVLWLGVLLAFARFAEETAGRSRRPRAQRRAHGDSEAKE